MNVLFIIHFSQYIFKSKVFEPISTPPPHSKSIFKKKKKKTNTWGK